MDAPQEVFHKHHFVYHGLDRRPPFIAPDPVIRKQLGEPLVEDEKLYRGLIEWFDLHHGPTSFIMSQYKAFELFKLFTSHHYKLDLIFCDLVLQTEEIGRMKIYPKYFGKASETSINLGFDVCRTSANHSAIFQPGIVRGNVFWEKKLNQWGLFNNYDEALLLKNKCNHIYPEPELMSDIFFVHRTPVFSLQVSCH